MGTLALEQVSEAMAKSPAFEPERVAAPAPKVRVSEPEFVIVNVVADDVVPGLTVPNDPDEGEVETAGTDTWTAPMVKAPDRVANVWSVVMPVPNASGAPLTRTEALAGTRVLLLKAPRAMAEVVARLS
jgi:hypothetical protein